MQHHSFFTLIPSRARFARGVVRRSTIAAGFSFWARRAAMIVALSGASSCALVPARAQGTAASRGAGYKLGPGDVLSLTVTDHPEYSAPSLVVPPDGSVSLPSYGTINLTGRTRQDVQNDLRVRLISHARLRKPLLALIITAARPPAPTFIGRVILSGEVPRPGSFEVRRNERLSDLLAEAGVGERLEEKRAILVRGAGHRSLDLARAARTPGSAADLFLRPGDSIAVSATTAGKIRISGDVARPGDYEMHLAPKSETEVGLAPRLSDLLTKAGWQRSAGAASASGGASASEVSTGGAGSGASAGTPTWTGTLQRGGRTISVSPEAALGRSGGADDIALRAGDFVSIRQVPPIRVSIVGQVAHIGSYALPPGTGIRELLVQAGDITGPQDGIVASVQRGNQTLPLDLNALLVSSGSSANLTLQDGDFVQVRAPETLPVSIAGQVTRPGDIQVRPGSSVFEAINQAGGVVGDPADLRISVLRREAGGTQDILPVDAPAVIGARDMKTNHVLQRGDTINVARLGTQTVFINGEVVNPNSFTLRGGEGITQLLTRAGGPKNGALLSGIRVTRGGQVLQVDALDAVKKGTPLDFELQDADQVIVPRNPNVIKVIGAAKEGDYFIPERGQLTLIDVLAQAAPAPGAKQLFVAHALPDGTYTKNASGIDINKVLHGTAPNIVLQSHDVIYVPAPKARKSALDTLGQLSVFRLFF